jgi:hypothetical protein
VFVDLGIGLLNELSPGLCIERAPFGLQNAMEQGRKLPSQNNDNNNRDTFENIANRN